MKMYYLLGRKKESRLPKTRLQGMSLRTVNVGIWDGLSRPHIHSFTSSPDDQH